MKIVRVDPQPDWNLLITTADGRIGRFDVQPYLHYEAFEPLKDTSEFLILVMEAILLNGVAG